MTEFRKSYGFYGPQDTRRADSVSVHDITVVVPAITAYGSVVTPTATQHEATGGTIPLPAPTWSVTATPDVATIDAVTGALTVTGDGTFEVIATAVIAGSARSGAQTVTVAISTTVATIDAIAPVTLAEGSTVQLAPVARNASGGAIVGAPFSYASVDGGVHETVSTTGLITGILAGAGSITVSAGGITRTVTVTVTPDLVPAAIVVTLNNDTSLGVPVNLGRTVTDAYAVNSVGVRLGDAVTLASATPSTMRYDSTSRRLTMLATGAATLRATCGAVTHDVALTATTALPLDLLWIPAEDGITPRVLADPRNGPVDIAGLQTGYIKDSSSWGITPKFRTLTGWAPSHGAVLSATNTNGAFFYASGDTKVWSAGNYGCLIEHLVSTDEWASLATVVPQKAALVVRARCPAGFQASLGRVFRFRVCKGHYLPDRDAANTPTEANCVGSVDVALTNTLTPVVVPFDMSAVTDPTTLYFAVGWPASPDGSFVTDELEIEFGHIAGGGTIDATALNRYAPIHSSLGLWAADSAINCALWSDDFTNAVWTKTGVTVTGAQGNCPDFTLTASQWSRLAFASGGTLKQTVTLINNNVTPYVPDYVWVHLPAKQDGANALPADGDLIAELIGTVGTTSANMVRETISGHVFYRARVPYKATNAGETNTSPVVQIRAKTGTTPQLLAVRAGVEPERSDSAGRNVGSYAMLVPLKTTTVAMFQSQNQAQVMHSGDIADRYQGTRLSKLMLPYDPATLADPADKRFRYTGPNASSLTYVDDKFTAIGGSPRYQFEMWDVSGSDTGDKDHAEQPITLGDFPPFTAFAMAAVHGRVTPRRMDAYWVKGVKFTSGITTAAPTGAGTATWQFGGADYGAIDCDAVDSVCGFEIARVSSKTALSDAQMDALHAGLP